MPSSKRDITPTNIDTNYDNRLNLYYSKRKSNAKVQLNMSMHVGEKCGKRVWQIDRQIHRVTECKRIVRPGFTGGGLINHHCCVLIFIIMPSKWLHKTGTPKVCHQYFLHYMSLHVCAYLLLWFIYHIYICVSYTSLSTSTKLTSVEYDLKVACDVSAKVPLHTLPCRIHVCLSCKLLNRSLWPSAAKPLWSWERRPL